MSQTKVVEKKCHGSEHKSQIAALFWRKKKKKEVEFLCWKEIITERFKAFYLCWQVQDQRCLRWLKMHFRVISHSFSRLSLQAAANSGWWLYPHYNQMWMRSGPWGVSEHRPLWSWSTISASALILFFFFYVCLCLIVDESMPLICVILHLHSHRCRCVGDSRPFIRWKPGKSVQPILATRC